MLESHSTMGILIFIEFLIAPLSLSFQLAEGCHVTSWAHSVCHCESSVGLPVILIFLCVIPQVNMLTLLVQKSHVQTHSQLAQYNLSTCTRGKHYSLPHTDLPIPGYELPSVPPQQFLRK